MAYHYLHIVLCRQWTAVWATGIENTFQPISFKKAKEVWYKTALFLLQITFLEERVWRNFHSFMYIKKCHVSHIHKHDMAIYSSSVVLVYRNLFFLPTGFHLKNIFWATVSRLSVHLSSQAISGASAFFYDYFHKMPPHTQTSHPPPRRAGLRTPIPEPDLVTFCLNHHKQEEQFIWQETCLLKRSHSRF